MADLYCHTVTVTRRSGRVDRFGQPVDVNPHIHGPENVVSQFPGRLTRSSGGLTMRERSLDTFEVFHTLFCIPDADINEDDGVTVEDSDGRVLIEGAKVKQKTMAYDYAGAHHLEVTLWTQRGPQ